MTGRAGVTYRLIQIDLLFTGLCVLNRPVTVQTAGVLDGHMLLMHQRFIPVLFEMSLSIMTSTTILLLYPFRAKNQGGFELAFLEIGLVFGSA